MKSLPISIPLEEITAFCRRNGVRYLALFGSVLRGDFRPDSDVDILVEFEPDKRIGLIGFAGLENQLSRMLGRKVDLNTADGLSPYYADEVLHEAVPIYAAL